jgi:predicted  nucleic acid-binding Zn-ribbon protein
VSDEPDNLTHVMLRRMDAKLDRIIDDVADLKVRMSSVELEVARLAVRVAETNARIDRVEVRLDRIERRLDLTEVHP